MHPRGVYVTRSISGKRPKSENTVWEGVGLSFVSGYAEICKERSENARKSAQKMGLRFKFNEHQHASVIPIQ